jgi:hypothetical protein
LIHESVKYDWQELKDRVDHGEGNKNLFYKKYFFWQSRSLEEGYASMNVVNHNSNVRSAIGVGPKSMDAIISRLPAHQGEENFEQLLNKMVAFGNYRKILTHYSNKFLHQCFDYLSKLYINKFDVDTAQIGLLRYSTNFPWYFVWLSKTSVLRWTTLFVISMMVLAGLFDSSTYQFEEQTTLAPAASFLKSLLGENLFQTGNWIFFGFWITILSTTFLAPLIIILFLIKKYVTQKVFKQSFLDLKFLELVRHTESNRSNLLYLSFVIPLLLVIMQMANTDTIGMINNINGLRLISTIIIIIGLTISAVYMHVREKNQYKSPGWIAKRTEHMFWLHLLQALLITIFIIDLMLRLEITLESFDGPSDLFSFGISKFIRIDIGYFDYIIMPVFTIMVSFLTLFFSFFIDKVLGNKND